MNELQELWSEYQPELHDWLKNFLFALIVLLVGLRAIKYILHKFKKLLTKRSVNQSLQPFLVTLLRGLLVVSLVISVLGIVGIQTASFTVILGSMGLAIGLALQGSLGNFAGGVILLLLRPFKVGDFIEANGVAGTVREIQIFHTFITTPQNQEIIVPNGALSNATVKNYSFHDTRRLDCTFGIGYSDDVAKAKAILENIIQEDERFLKEAGHDVFVEALADSSVNLHFRAWVTNSDFWDVYNALNEKVKTYFDAHQISIPFPQMDVHLPTKA